MTHRPGSPWRVLGQRVHLLRQAFGNASEMLRKGRLGGEWRTPFHVLMTDHHVTLRRHAHTTGVPDAPRRPILLVPPLMVTAEIYDISPEMSAVAWLSKAGADVWVADFGTPEAIEGGLERTLDDHILAISRCIDAIRSITAHDVHLVGYSQGGMFCYQAAAFRKNIGIASIATFGSPVDIRRNLPIRMHDSLAARLIGGLRRLIGRPLGAVRGIPGTMSSSVFKLLAPRQELRHLVQMLGLLHDRDALMALEPQRRFLGGEGFIAWPGPALRTFIDEFIVHNRMKEGGFVIAGRTVSLADLQRPILCFVGTRDDLAFPESVRGIAEAAPDAPLTFVEVDAGHFGLVIGRKAREVSWPTLLSFAAALDRGETPASRTVAAESVHAGADAGKPRERRRKRSRRKAFWARLGAVGVDIGEAFDTMRWNLPRLMSLARLSPDAMVSFSSVLKRQAREHGERSFFIRDGRAFTFQDADTRVNAFMRALIVAGVRRSDRVAVTSANPATFLIAIAALNRLGAVAVVGPRSGAVSSAFQINEFAADAAGSRARLLVTGPAGEGMDLDLMMTDATSLDVATAETLMPADWRPDGGCGADAALVVAPASGRSRRVSNRRWLAMALNLANRLELKSSDTLWCGLPLDGTDGLVLAVGAALVGGARLALPGGDALRDKSWFLKEIRHVGATVACVETDFIATLLGSPPEPQDRRHPLRKLLVRNPPGNARVALRSRFGKRLQLIRIGKGPRAGSGQALPAAEADDGEKAS